MKKRLSIIVAICLFTFSVTACGSSGEPAKTVTFDLPEGFVETQEDYYSPEDSTKSSYISYFMQENNGTFGMINAATLMQSTEMQLESMYNADIEITLLDEESYQIDGFPALKYTTELTLSGYKFVQTQVVVGDTQNIHFINYTEVNDEGYLDVFAESAKTIRVE